MYRDQQVYRQNLLDHLNGQQQNLAVKAILGILTRQIMAKDGSERLDML